MFWEVYALDRQEYLKSLTEQIRTKRARTMVAEEVEAHIEDQKQDFMAHGLGEEEAESMAVAEMGDPVEAGVKLDCIHRPKTEWTILISILVVSVMGLILQAIITSSFPTTSVNTVNAFRNNFLYGGVWISLIIGIVMMLGISYLDYSLLVKYSFPIWIILEVPAILSILTQIFFDESIWIGPMVNGRSVLQMYLSYLVIPFYAGIVYHFRGKGKKGLMRCILCLGISVFADLSIPFTVSAIVTGVTGMILIHLAIRKGWFGEEKKRFIVGIWSVIGICIVVVGGFTCLGDRHFMNDYQVHRLTAIVTGNHYDYTRDAVAEVAQGQEISKWSSEPNYKTDNKSINEESTNIGDSLLYNSARNDYIWTYLSHYFGIAKVIFFIAVFAVFLALLLHMAVRQKNRLGYIVSIGCVLYLILQSVFYVGVNIGIFPFGDAFMPLLSHGNVNMLITYFYLGILLSVYRNTNIVKN